MAEELKENQQEEKTEALSGGAYEILRKRLLAQNDNLLDRINELNIKRRDVFGGMESTVIGNERIKTENNCVPIDVVSIGDHLLFAYKVFIGMKTETHISDVFSAHHFDGTEFHAPKKDILNLPEFERDFKELFKYYKYAQFQQFVKTSNRISTGDYTWEKGNLEGNAFGNE